VSPVTVIDAIIFDFDLTLADSGAGATECANFALRSLGLAEAEAVTVRRTIGLSLSDSFRALTGIDDVRVADEFRRHFVQRADEVMASMTLLYPGVPAVLRGLRERGLRTGIVSTKFRYRIEEILRLNDADTLIDAIVGGEDVTDHKPHPSGILAMLSKLDVASSRAIYVGDHQVDVLAAKAAGVKFVGVLTGVTTRSGFAEVDAHDVFSSVTDLAALKLGAG